MSGKTYGYFDDDRREYVITDPLTPRPWSNYLSNNRLGAFVSQGAGGVAWYHQPVTQRLSRYNFLNLPEDRPGFYVYVREEDGTYWNPSYHPSQTYLDRWECRHGMGYTRFLAERAQIEAELMLCIPPNDDVLVWDLTLCNKGQETQCLFLTNYLEFSLLEYYKEILGWIVLRNQIRFRYDPAVQAVKYDYFVYEAEHTNAVFLTTNANPSSFDCDRSVFIGRGRDTTNPQAVEWGRLSNSELPGGGVGIAALAHAVTLPPGGSARFVWTLGAAETWEEADALAVKYHDIGTADAARAHLQKHWDHILSTFQADVPDADMQSMVNAWNPHGTVTTFFRDRDISSELTGLASGIRFRDAMQNCMSMCSLHPAIARERICLLLSHQRNDGSAVDVFRPGAKAPPESGQTRCDNTVWSPITLYSYLAETGDMAFLNQVLPYVDGKEVTVYEHVMQGLRQIARDVGDHGLPLLKGRDWDDHLCLFAEEGAESVMTAQNWCYAGRLMQEICRACKREEHAEWLEGKIREFTQALNGPAWDGEWYRQVLYRGKRVPLGSRHRRENKIYINTQSWAVISATAPEERARLCMDRMREYLNTDYGIKFLIPPYTGIPEPEDPLVSNGPGLGENGGIFIQANCWAIMAETVLCRGEYAYEYYHKILPSVLSRHSGPEIYLNEPYMISSWITADPDTRRGQATLSWLTGSVNWMYIIATQYLLGIRPTLAGLQIRPCIPSGWDGFSVTRRYRGAVYRIKVKNNRTAQVPRIRCNDREVEGSLLPVLPLGEQADIKVII